MWLSVTEAKKKYNKSESSIRRVIKELKQTDLTQLQFEKLSNGIDRILISDSHLNSIFNSKKNDTNKTYSDSGSSDMVKHLLNEIEEKNKQIERLHVLMGNLQSKVLQLDEAPTKKKRWFQRNR